jgi:hypothetical protein
MAQDEYSVWVSMLTSVLQVDVQTSKQQIDVQLKHGDLIRSLLNVGSTLWVASDKHVSVWDKELHQCIKKFDNSARLYCMFLLNPFTVGATGWDFKLYCWNAKVHSR